METGVYLLEEPAGNGTAAACVGDPLSAGWPRSITRLVCHAATESSIIGRSVAYMPSSPLTQVPFNIRRITIGPSAARFGYGTSRSCGRFEKQSRFLCF